MRRRTPGTASSATIWKLPTRKGEVARNCEQARHLEYLVADPHQRQQQRRSFPPQMLGQVFERHVGNLVDHRRRVFLHQGPLLAGGGQYLLVAPAQTPGPSAVVGRADCQFHRVHDRGDFNPDLVFQLGAGNFAGFFQLQVMEHLVADARVHHPAVVQGRVGGVESAFVPVAGEQVISGGRQVGVVPGLPEQLWERLRPVHDTVAIPAVIQGIGQAEQRRHHKLGGVAVGDYWAQEPALDQLDQIGRQHLGPAHVAEDVVAKAVEQKEQRVLFLGHRRDRHATVVTCAKAPASCGTERATRSASSWGGSGLFASSTRSDVAGAWNGISIPTTSRSRPASASA